MRVPCSNCKNHREKIIKVQVSYVPKVFPFLKRVGFSVNKMVPVLAETNKRHQLQVACKMIIFSFVCC